MLQMLHAFQASQRSCKTAWSNYNFDLPAILQKRENLRTTSKKSMRKTTDSQDLKLTREDL